MTSVPQLQPSQRATLDALLAGFRRAIGADLFALYVYGAITFPETEGVIDLDYHAILERPPTPVQVAGEHAPWGADLDGWVILRRHAGGAEPPAHVIAGIPDGSWPSTGHTGSPAAALSCGERHQPRSSTLRAGPRWRRTCAASSSSHAARPTTLSPC